MHRNLFVFAALLAALGASLQAHAATSCTAGNPNTTSVAESTPTSAFTDNLDGTVTHNLTGLMWKRCSEGQAWNGSTCTGSATTFIWANALIQAKNANFASQTDWRLPNKKELESIVEFCGYNPAINQTMFPATPAFTFWSGSSYAYVPPPTFAWYVNFNDGGTDFFNKSNVKFVRLVRGGQLFDSFDAQKTNQTIIFGAAPTVNVGGTGTVSASGGASGNAVTFSSTTPGVCTVSGSTVTGVAAGTCIIAAVQAGNATYNPAQVTQSFAVGKGSQSISFTSTAPVAAVVGGATYAVSANGGASGNAVTFAIDAAASTVCSISGATVSFTGAGTCVINADQLGNANYNAAAQAQQSFAVAPAITYTGATATGSGTATATVVSGGGAGCAFTSAGFVSPGSAPAGVTFPHGLLNFTLGGCTAGSTVTLSIAYPSAVPAGTQYWKYGRTLASPATPIWYAITPTSISGNTVTFTVTDGGSGDDDRLANGTIVDPGGIGVQGAATAVPTLSEWGMILLAGMLGLFGMGVVRRRSRVV